MKKNILIISILTCSLSFAQYDWTPGKLILKNGETLKGLIKIPTKTIGLLTIGSNKIQYKKEKKGKKKKYSKSQVDKIYFGTFNPNVGYYEYIPIKMKRTAVCKLIRNGKVKLYTRTIKIGVNNSYGVGGMTNGSKDVKKVKEYYILRENERFATNVLQDKDDLSSLFYKGNLKSFKNYMKRYFSDCKKVVSYIENDLYEDFDIAQIVEDYNLFCE